MDGDASEEGGCERARSWYLTQEEIERGSPSRRDGVGAAKEAELRTTYCCFIHDVCTRLQLPQITRATAILLCHRFYLHQSHAKNEWQTIATVCVFLASKIEDTPRLLKHVVIAAYETMYRKTPDAAKRIHQEEVLAKQKDLILVGETLLLSTIRFDFNIQHPYEPLKLALTNLGISHKEVRQLAMRFINDTLPTTLVVQFKPHSIAAGSLFYAAKFHNFELPYQNGKMWWNEFGVDQKQLQAVIQEMSELLFKKRDPCSMVSANKPVPTPIPTPTDKHQQIKPPATPALMDKQTIKLIPTPTLTDRQQKTRTPAPALRHTQSSMRSFSSSNTKASSCVTAGSSFDKLTSSSASNEESRYQQTGKENRQRTNEENQYRRTNEQNQYRRTNEQSQHRRMDEENRYRRRMDEENQHRRRMDEENQYRRRMDGENQYRQRMNEENQYRRTYEENQHRWRNEENQHRWMNEEKQYRRMNDKKQSQQAHRNHNVVPVDQRLEKQSYRGTLKSDGGYHATIIMDLTIQKRRIQDPVYISDANDWRIGPLKKQKLERR